MISDAPYQTKELALVPWMGLAGGTTGALGMLGLLAAWPAAGGTMLETLAKGMVQSTPVAALAPSVAEQWLMLAVGHLVLGAIAGLLFAVCQQRAAMNVLLSVGFFYGLLLWVIGGMAASFLGPLAQGTLRSGSMLSASLLFGLWMSVLACWASRRQSVSLNLPKD